MRAPTYEEVVLKVASLFQLDSAAERLVPRVKPLLERAGIFLPPKVYSRFVLAMLLYPIPGELLALGLPAVQGEMLASALTIIQLAPIVLPLSRARTRGRAVDQELPFFLMALTVFSREAVPSFADAMKKVSDLGAKVFPAFSRESAILERNLTFAQAPPGTVLEASFANHPSRGMREIVHGFQTTVETGREVIEYVEEETRRFIGLLGDSWKAFAESVGSLAEVSFLLLALFPVGLEMVAAAIPGLATSEMLLSFLVLISLFSLMLILIIDAIQPRLYDATPGSAHLALVIASWLLATLLFYWKATTIDVSLLLTLTVSSVSVLAARRHHARIKKGEEEVSLLLHTLAEQSKAGMSLPESLSRVSLDSAAFEAIGDPLSAFHQAIQLGHSPSEAQKGIDHPSWLVRLSFGILSIAFITGAGFEQLERLSSFFKRVSDSRRSVSRSLLPFAGIGVAVPAFSSGSIVLLRSFSESGVSFLPQFSQVSQSYILLSISATSLLTGLILSKLYTLTVRYVIAVPILFLSTLLSLLFLGLA